MPHLTTYSRYPEDEPILQQLETHLQCLSFDKKGAVTRAITEELAVVEQLQEAAK